MSEFYRYPNWGVTALVMAIALCIVLQIRAISYSICRLRTGWVRRVENGMECVILAVLLLFAALLAQVQYGLFCGFLIPSSYDFARQAVFLLAAVLGTTAAVGTELSWPFFCRRCSGSSASFSGEDHRGCISILFSDKYVVLPDSQYTHLLAAPARALHPDFLYICERGY